MSVESPLAATPDRLAFRYDHTVADYDALQKYLKTHGKDGKLIPRTSPLVKFWLAFMIGLPIAILLFQKYSGVQVFKMREPLESERSAPMPGWLAMVLFILIVIGVYSWIVSRIRLWLQRRPWKKGDGGKNWSCTIRADGLAAGSEQIMTEYRWPAVTRVVLTKLQILFYIANSQVVILPRRALGSSDDLIRVAAYLRKWYSGPVIDEEGKPVSAESALLLE